MVTAATLSAKVLFPHQIHHHSFNFLLVFRSTSTYTLEKNDKRIKAAWTSYVIDPMRALTLICFSSTRYISCVLQAPLLVKTRASSNPPKVSSATNCLDLQTRGASIFPKSYFTSRVVIIFVFLSFCQTPDAFYES